jgi:glycerophosphoryl diester phosphodiesterase
VLPAWLMSTPIAHRGLFSLEAGRPENSLAAFDAAAAAGYPCELDVQLTDSGELVVFHDFDLLRATGVAWPTATLTAVDRAGTKLFGTDQRVPTLAEVIDCVRGRIPLQIEIKRRRHPAARVLAGAVLDGLGGSHGDFALSSFDPLVVFWLRSLREPRFPVGQICGTGLGLGGNFVTRPDFIACGLAGLPSRAVARWRERGAPVLAWTVRSAEDERRAKKYADNIIFEAYLPAAVATAT